MQRNTELQFEVEVLKVAAGGFVGQRKKRLQDKEGRMHRSCSSLW